MKETFQVLTVVSAILMVITILLQSKGAGLGRAFGGGDSDGYRTKRGAEKVVYNTTVLSAVVFVMSVILGILSKN